jgi:hypothetical protein
VDQPASFSEMLAPLPFGLPKYYHRALESSKCDPTMSFFSIIPDCPQVIPYQFSISTPNEVIFVISWILDKAFVLSGSDAWAKTLGVLRKFTVKSSISFQR